MNKVSVNGALLAHSIWRDSTLGERRLFCQKGYAQRRSFALQYHFYGTLWDKVRVLRSHEGIYEPGKAPHLYRPNDALMIKAGGPKANRGKTFGATGSCSTSWQQSDRLVLYKQIAIGMAWMLIC
ncbi:MAG: hypothetical protein AB1861_18895 [Cyanobacteriota bacterium]